MISKGKTDQVTINLDGKDVEVPDGMNLVDAVALHGKEIPHYCYHPQLSVAGNCRMCLIEMGTPMRDRGTGEAILDEEGSPKIGWVPKPVIGCGTNVSPGMHVKTESDMVTDCREGIMEFLLVNHPLDCPICDQAGECRLQEFATDYGTSGIGFTQAHVQIVKLAFGDDSKTDRIYANNPLPVTVSGNSGGIQGISGEVRGTGGFKVRNFMSGWVGTSLEYLAVAGSTSGDMVGISGSVYGLSGGFPVAVTGDISVTNRVTILGPTGSAKNGDSSWAALAKKASASIDVVKPKSLSDTISLRLILLKELRFPP